MARKAFKIDTRSSRAKLETGRDYAITLSPGCYLVYRSHQRNQAGSFRARWRNPETGKILAVVIGHSDDCLDDNGADIYAFKRACEKAQDWFAACARAAHREATGQVIQEGPFLVNDALNLKLVHAKKEGQQLSKLISHMDSRIRPQLGHFEVSHLTKKRVEDWLMALAESPRMVAAKGGARIEGSWGDDGPSEDALRARKMTANRVFAILKHALNLAVLAGHIEIGPWRDVKPFSKKKNRKSRIRFLNLDEQKRLINVCPPDFRKLVIAALYTGSRYSPLTRLVVRDFNPQSGTLFIEKDKYSKSRHIILTQEAADWFSSITAGRAPHEKIFQRTSAKRKTRKDVGLDWASSDQRPFMEAACEAAKIERMVFHELRHTYASNLINAAVPLVFVAEQLGHVNTEMVELHYGHLCPSAKRDSIRSLAPSLGIEPENIQPLEIKGA